MKLPTKYKLVMKIEKEVIKTETRLEMSSHNTEQATIINTEMAILKSRLVKLILSELP